MRLQLGRPHLSSRLPTTSSGASTVTLASPASPDDSPTACRIREGICFYCVGGVYKNRRGDLDYAIAETIQEGKRWKARRAAAKRRADGRAVDLAERLAARDAAVAEFKTAHPQLIASMTRLAATDSTVQNMLADMDSSGALPDVGVAESLIARLAHAEALLTLRGNAPGTRRVRAFLPRRFTITPAGGRSQPPVPAASAINRMMEAVC